MVILCQNYQILSLCYNYCHGRSTLGVNYSGNIICFNRNTDFDKLLLNELKKYYKNIIIIESKYNDDILVDYEMLIKSMYLTKYIAANKNKDLSKVDYSPLVKNYISLTEIYSKQ